MRVFALTCGWLTSDLGLLLAGEPGRVRLPVPSWVIDHPAGVVVFDTGMHPATQHDPVGRLGNLMARLFTVDFHAGEELAARLAMLGIDALRVPWLVSSHLHFDHTGGNAQLPNARLVVQRREWDAGRNPDVVAKLFYDPKDYDLGHDVLLVDGEHDLFGDGRVVCVPTFGHTPGHQSLRLRLDDGQSILLAADACYFRRTLEHLHLPPSAYDADAMIAALHRMRAWQAEGVRIFFGHDGEFWNGVPQAPATIT